MDRFRNYISVAAGLVILAGAFTVIGPYVDQGQADPPVKDVNIVNTPLPVTGVLVRDVLVTNTADEPIPVVVQNGDADNADETMLLSEGITLGDGETLELDSVEMRGFTALTFLGAANCTAPGPLDFRVEWRFLVAPGTYSSPIAKVGGGGSCSLRGGDAANCLLFDRKGPHVAVLLSASRGDLGTCTLDQLYLYLTK